MKSTTMTDYIKREDALKWICIDGCNACEDSGGCEYRDTDKACSDCLYSDVKNIPAADVRENVRGEWVGEADGYADGNPVYDMWYCSHCGYRHDEDEPPKWNYCPNCGADMRGEKDG